MSALRTVADLPIAAVLERQQSSAQGLDSHEAQSRLTRFGPNAISTRHVRWWQILVRQFRNPILWLLSVVVIISAALGDTGNSAVIGLIVVMSVGLSFVTEFRAEKAAAALHARVSHSVTVVRDGTDTSISITNLVPGDVVRLGMGAIVPADIRLLSVNALECDESIISGESQAVVKTIDPDTDGFRNCALMGTIVRSGTGTGVVVATGPATEFGQIAEQLSSAEPETYFQVGLRRFSNFLLVVALILTVAVIIGNLVLGRPLLGAILFALALAVGMTPQLLPAILSSSLAMGSRQLAKQGVLVKRLISIEDLGDIDMLVTDKTGTLTTGVIEYDRTVPLGKTDPLGLGLLVIDLDYAVAARSTAALSALDAAMWSTENSRAVFGALGHVTKIASLPFDHQRRLASVVATVGTQKMLVTKGSPDDLLPRCNGEMTEATKVLNELYSQGSRVIAVASKPHSSDTVTGDDEKDLTLIGFLCFTDQVKPDAKKSLQALANLGIDVKIATGDSAVAASALCRQLGIDMGEPLTGVEIDSLTDAELVHAVESRAIFARVSPEQKSRIIKALQRDGRAVGFLGDGVNDSIALHESDVGISVDSATDVAKDAADVVLLEKDLTVLANGIELGRRVFNNTIKYLLMGTSGDFGNMFSAAIGSVLLPFLPMTPSQVLLQDLMYDSSQLAIPSDRVDAEQLVRPSHWNIGLIRRFMLVFGPISSIFDLATFGLMAWGFHANEAEFQTGWFVESLATATLIALVIRTRRVPFFRSSPSRFMMLSILGIVVAGAVLPYSPLAIDLGFTPLPLPFFAALAGMIVAYLCLVEFAKFLFFRKSHTYTS
ncbi:MAG: hypothetical protein RLZ72_130, partial [Actinomycetota bacterium]